LRILGGGILLTELLLQRLETSAMLQKALILAILCPSRFHRSALTPQSHKPTMPRPMKVHVACNSMWVGQSPKLEPQELVPWQSSLPRRCGRTLATDFQSLLSPCYLTVDDKARWILELSMSVPNESSDLGL